MEDNEKNRVEYVALLESRQKHMQAELDRYKGIAEQWEPKFLTAADTASGKVTFGLTLGGKKVHATVSNDYLLQVDLTSGTSTILDALVESLVVEMYRKVLLPEVDKAQRGVKATAGAGKW